MTPELEAVVLRYADAWNRHDVDAILALHTEDAVFENHTSGGRAIGKLAIRELLEGIFRNLPDLCFTTRRAYITETVAVVEWTATATHQNPISWGTRTLPPTGRKMTWNGLDVLPIRSGLVVRKDVYVDSLTFLRQAGAALP